MQSKLNVKAPHSFPQPLNLISKHTTCTDQADWTVGSRAMVYGRGQVAALLPPTLTLAVLHGLVQSTTKAKEMAREVGGKGPGPTEACPSVHQRTMRKVGSGKRIIPG